MRLPMASGSFSARRRRRSRTVALVSAGVCGVLLLLILCGRSADTLSLGESGDVGSSEVQADGHGDTAGSSETAGQVGVAQEPGDASASALPPDAGGAIRRISSERSLEEEARELLVAYRDQGDCVLVRSGPIDLLGNAWSCVIQGPDWVDVCVVRRDKDLTASEVTICRMDIQEWEESANESGLLEGEG